MSIGTALTEDAKEHFPPENPDILQEEVAMPCWGKEVRRDPGASSYNQK